jgi:hypothetical protein
MLLILLEICLCRCAEVDTSSTLPWRARLVQLLAVYFTLLSLRACHISARAVPSSALYLLGNNITQSSSTSIFRAV